MKLDDAYANGAYIAGAQEYPPRWAAAAKATRLATAGARDVSYGPSARQVYDIFEPKGPPKGTFVFVHGGYWLKFDKSWWSHLAEGALAHGWSVAMPSYDLCPEVGIADITRQIAAFLGKLSEETDGPIVLAGHSAGGHLVARMICEGVLPEEVVSRIVKVVPISPVADLRPLLETTMNEEFKLDLAAAEAESPVLKKPVAGIPVTVWVGADERPAFVEQATRLAQSWGCDVMIAGGKHHFDVIDALGDVQSDLMGVLIQNGLHGRATLSI